MINFVNNPTAGVSQMSKETDHVDTSINAGYGKITPLSNNEITETGENNNTTDSKSQLHINYSTGGPPPLPYNQNPKHSKIERMRVESEFKIRFYDNLLY